MQDTSVYVHFPYCLKKCPYCDFNSYGTAREAVPHGAYADAVLRELDARSDALRGRKLVSIFFGGGTPSLWEPRELGRVLAGIRAAFPQAEHDLEITVECNPTSLDRARAASLRKEGVNRISIGVQSLDDDRLGFLGRLHDSSGALRALREALLEMERVSADLMFGMPKQRASDFTAELERILETGVRHVSAYALTIEPGTQFGELHKKGRLPLAPEDDYAETFLAARACFASHGLSHYEISNYAHPGQESRHNQHYWRGGDYLGLGAGAVGCFSSENGSARRWRDEPLPARYIESSHELEHVETWHELLAPEDRIREALMLGLRTHEGVDLEAVRRRTGLDPEAGREDAIERRCMRGELERDGTRMRVPQAHWLALDAIVTDLF